jgi:hypothetical protein
MDGMAMAARVVDLADGPAPFCMRDGEAERIRAAARAAREARRDPAAANATAETLRRKKGDVVAVLWSEDRLTLHQVSAAEEVLRVFSLITGGLGGRVTGSYAAREDKGWVSEVLPPALHAAYVERYCPWRDWAGRMMVAGAHTVGDLVLLVVVDNLGPRQVERRLGLRHGAGLALLRKGLHQYAAMAGWVQDYPTLTVRG